MYFLLLELQSKYLVDTSSINCEYSDHVYSYSNICN